MYPQTSKVEFLYQDKMLTADQAYSTMSSGQAPVVLVLPTTPTMAPSLQKKESMVRLSLMPGLTTTLTCHFLPATLTKTPTAKTCAKILSSVRLENPVRTLLTGANPANRFVLT